jgi:hypothetical protein
VRTKQGRVHANPHTEPLRLLPPRKEALPCTEARRRDMGAVFYLPDEAFFDGAIGHACLLLLERSGLCTD